MSQKVIQRSLAKVNRTQQASERVHRTILFAFWFCTISCAIWKKLIETIENNILVCRLQISIAIYKYWSCFDCHTWISCRKIVRIFTDSGSVSLSRSRSFHLTVAFCWFCRKATTFERALKVILLDSDAQFGGFCKMKFFRECVDTNTFKLILRTHWQHFRTTFTIEIWLIHTFRFVA